MSATAITSRPMSTKRVGTWPASASNWSCCMSRAASSRTAASGLPGTATARSARLAKRSITGPIEFRPQPSVNELVPPPLQGAPTVTVRHGGGSCVNPNHAASVGRAWRGSFRQSRLRSWCHGPPVPADPPGGGVREVALSTRVTRGIRLNVPLLSAAMDTVTEARLAIAIAQEGGIGVIHKSMSIEAQTREVGRVKKFESGVIRDPITVSPDMSIREVLDLTRSRGISGVPVVVGRKAVGIVTHRDLRFEDRCESPVSTVMTPKERLVTVREDAPEEEVLALLHKHRIES